MVPGYRCAPTQSMSTAYLVDSHVVEMRSGQGLDMMKQGVNLSLHLLAFVGCLDGRFGRMIRRWSLEMEEESKPVRKLLAPIVSHAASRRSGHIFLQVQFLALFVKKYDPGGARRFAVFSWL